MPAPTSDGSSPAELTEFAPAKLNLALHVRARRPDGYHALETLFAFCADIGDRLRAAPAERITLTLTGPKAAALTGEGDNLVLRAARLLAEAAGVDAGARLTLDKRLPVASGIGGGSADAAATLRLLNRLWGLGWSLERLMPLAARLGADVPACLHGRAALGRGAGEVLDFMASPWAGAALILANCRQPVSTAAVFAGWDGIDRGPLDPARPDAWRNDLEAPATRLAPAIADTLAALGTLPGVRLACMSGSGATCLALLDDPARALPGRQALAAAHPDWWIETGRLA